MEVPMSLSKKLFIVMFLILFACNIGPPETKEIKKSDNKIKIVFEGVIYPSKEFKILAPITEKVKKILKKDGDWVNAGDTILEFNIDDAMYDYKEALIDYKIAKIRAGNEKYIPTKSYEQRVLINNAKEKLLKTYSLYRQGYTSLSELKQAENEYMDILNRANAENGNSYNSKADIKRQKEATEEVTKAFLEVERQKQRLKEKFIKSPVSGFLANLKVISGQTVTQDDVIGSVINIDKVKLKGAFFPGTYKFLRIGMMGNVQCLTTPSYESKGAIEKLSPIVDPLTGRMSLYMTLKNKNYILQPGTKCLITFDFNPKDVKSMGLDNKNKKIFIKSDIKSKEIK
jgi:multidrug efflux pump subunit AcrA (membrane-fusion protein)